MAVQVGQLEGLGIKFLASRMIGLFERYPGLEVELVAVPRFVSILNREAEISIHLERPSVDQLVTRKLTDYRLALYASRAYLDRNPDLGLRYVMASSQEVYRAIAEEGAAFDLVISSAMARKVVYFPPTAENMPLFPRCNLNSLDREEGDASALNKGRNPAKDCITSGFTAGFKK